MQLSTSAPMAARLKRGWLPKIGVVVLVLAVAAGAFALGRGGEHSTTARVLKGPSGDRFSIHYPSNWRPLSKDELALVGGSPLAALRRKDKSGFVIVRREKGRAGGDLQRFTSSLIKELKRKVPDFKARTAKVIKIRSGKAFFISYIRKRAGTVHGLVLVPAGSKTYTLNTVSAGKAPVTAREIGRIILSFDA